MNKQFVIKMMKAKQLQYEALKEIMPEKMAKRIGKLESEMLEVGKEYIMTVVCNPSNKEEKTSAEAKSGVRKVTIE